MLNFTQKPNERILKFSFCMYAAQKIYILHALSESNLMK